MTAEAMSHWNYEEVETNALEPCINTGTDLSDERTLSMVVRLGAHQNQRDMSAVRIAV